MAGEKKLTKKELAEEAKKLEDEKKAAEEKKIKIEEFFVKGDNLLFKKRNYPEALIVYREILKLERSNIDALNSVAYCTKFNAAATGQPMSQELFADLNKQYVRILEMDPFDVEANFNLGLLYLQFG